MIKDVIIHETPIVDLRPMSMPLASGEAWLDQSKVLHAWWLASAEARFLATIPLASE
jgi:hypothetical protein